MNNLLHNKMYKLSLLKFLIIKLTIQKVEKHFLIMKKWKTCFLKLQPFFNKDYNNLIFSSKKVNHFKKSLTKYSNISFALVSSLILSKLWNLL